MPLTREARLALHKKQERLRIKNGVPQLKELSEGIPEIRRTPEGLIEYIKDKGILYKKLLEKA